MILATDIIRRLEHTYHWVLPIVNAESVALRTHMDLELAMMCATFTLEDVCLVDTLV